jgi:hypothetical protein
MDVAVCLCVNAVANNVMLELYPGHDFYNIIFKVKHKLYIASGSAMPPTPPPAPTPQRKILGMHLLHAEHCDCMNHGSGLV